MLMSRLVNSDNSKGVKKAVRGSLALCHLQPAFSKMHMQLRLNFSYRVPASDSQELPSGRLCPRVAGFLSDVGPRRIIVQPLMTL